MKFRTVIVAFFIGVVIFAAPPRVFAQARTDFGQTVFINPQSAGHEYLLTVDRAPALAPVRLRQGGNEPGGNRLAVPPQDGAPLAESGIGGLPVFPMDLEFPVPREYTPRVPGRRGLYELPLGPAAVPPFPRLGVGEPVHAAIESEFGEKQYYPHENHTAGAAVTVSPFAAPPKRIALLRPDGETLLEAEGLAGDRRTDVILDAAGGFAASLAGPAGGKLLTTDPAVREYRNYTHPFPVTGVFSVHFAGAPRVGKNPRDSAPVPIGFSESADYTIESFGDIALFALAVGAAPSAADLSIHGPGAAGQRLLLFEGPVSSVPSGQGGNPATLPFNRFEPPVPHPIHITGESGTGTLSVDAELLRSEAIRIEFGDLVTERLAPDRPRIVRRLDVARPSAAGLLFRPAPGANQTLRIAGPSGREIAVFSGIAAQGFDKRIEFHEPGAYFFAVDGGLPPFGSPVPNHLILLGPNLVRPDGSNGGQRPGGEGGDGMVAYVDGVDTSGFPDQITVAVRVERDGEPVGDLARGHFADVIERLEGVSRAGEITGFVPPDQGTGAVDIVFAIDDSSSMMEPQRQVRENIEAFTRGLVARGKDFRLGLVRFGHELARVPHGSPIPVPGRNNSFTGSPTLFRNWFREFDILGRDEPSVDSVVFACGYPFREEAQAVVIVIGDEVSNGDLFTLNEANLALRSRSAVLYGILGNFFNTQENINTMIIELARESGGAVFDIEEPFNEILGEIGNEISSAHRITYRPPFPQFDGLTRLGSVRVERDGVVDNASFEYTVPLIADEPSPVPTDAPPAPSPTPFPTSTNTSAPAPSETPKPTSTPLPAPTRTPTFTPAPTSAPAHTNTPTASHTPTAETTPTATPRPSATPVPPRPTPAVPPTPTPTPELVIELCTEGSRLEQFAAVPVPGAPSDLSAADLDGVGGPELYTSLRGRNQLFLATPLTGTGGVRFATEIIDIGVPADSFRFGDINGDGAADLVAVSHLAETLVVRFATPGAPIEEWSETALAIHAPLYLFANVELAGKAQPLCLADADGDGAADIHVVEESAAGAFNRIVRFAWTGAPDGGRFERKELSIEPNPFGNLKAILLEDFDGDGELELAAISQEAGIRMDAAVHFLERAADSAYRPVFESRLDSRAETFRADDADGDGLADLLVVPFDERVRLYGAGPGGFTERELGNFQLNAILDDALIGDVERDGTAELLFAGRGKGNGFELAAVACGDEPGAFDRAAVFNSRREADARPNLRAELTDLNGDGLPDLVMLDNFFREMLFFVNRSEPRETSIPDWPIRGRGAKDLSGSSPKVPHKPE